MYKNVLERSDFEKSGNSADEIEIIKNRRALSMPALRMIDNGEFIFDWVNPIMYKSQKYKVTNTNNSFIIIIDSGLNTGKIILNTNKIIENKIAFSNLR